MACILNYLTKALLFSGQSDSVSSVYMWLLRLYTIHISSTMRRRSKETATQVAVSAFMGAVFCIRRTPFSS